MNRHQDSFSFFMSQFSKIFHNDERCERVKSWGWFIEHHHLRITDQLKCNRSSLFLTSRTSLYQIPSHLSIKTFLQLQACSQPLHLLGPLFLSTLDCQPGSKHQRLPNCQSLHENIILHDIICKLAKPIIVIPLPINSYMTLWLMLHPTSQNIKQSGLASTRCT